MLDVLLAAFIRHPRRTGVFGFAVAAVLLAALWWVLIWQSPQRAFTDMLANNLAAASVTKVAVAQAKSQGVEQYARLQMGSTNAADWLVVARQVDSAATTESIGTPAAGYIRYVQITSSRQDASRHFNFSKIVNVWSKSDGRVDTSLDHLFAQTVLDIGSAPLPPIANLPESERQNILAYIRDEKIFTPAYKDVKQENLYGRQVYTYTVSVRLGAYVRMMQTFARDVGLKNLDTIDPSQYSTIPPVKLRMSVNKTSHQLVGVAYIGSNFAQRYTDWGLVAPITVPATTISTTELQTRIQALTAGKS
jgi:hypothetical protein